MSHFKAKMHQIRFLHGVCPFDCLSADNRKNGCVH